MSTPSPRSGGERKPLPASLRELEMGDAALRYRRWPCHRCGHKARRVSVICPECEALPWPSARAETRSAVPGNGADPRDLFPEVPAGTLANQILKPGVELDTRSRGLLGNQHRFSTPSGFLGVLSRRFTSGADWLGGDGREWRIDRLGALGKAFILHDGPRPIAAAQTRGFWRGSYQVWQGARTFTLVRIGLTRRGFLLAVEDGPEVLRIQGGLIKPLRRIEVLSEVPVATVALAGFLACRMRQGESE